MGRLSSLTMAGVIVVLAVAVPQSGAQQPPPPAAPQLRIGFPKPLFRDVYPAMIDVAAQPFKQTILKTVQMNGSLEIVEDYRALATKIKNSQIDVAVFHGFEYSWVRDDKQMTPLVITEPNCGKVQACLVVNFASTAKGPKDLEGECVAIPKGSKAHCEMFLERIRAGLPADRCCPVKKTRKQTPEEVLDEIAGGDPDSPQAALVDISAVLIYQANKPGLGKCLKILTQSELLPSAVVVCRKGALSTHQMNAIKKELENCENTPQGSLFLTFWNLKRFTSLDDKYFSLLDKCGKTYPEPEAPKK